MRVASSRRVKLYTCGSHLGLMAGGSLMRYTTTGLIFLIFVFPLRSTGTSN